DLVEFLFSANPGEPLMPLARVASGGEISRVMLGIKASGAGRAGVKTLIFDEVDTGLSGRAAAVMARKLAELSRSGQVIVISHLPQIAARAGRHWRIEKVEEAGRSVTRLTPLEGIDREHELARMLAGESITETALANARELLESGG
ncbi:MAG: DNA repair protein RecN, partial [Fimbriimonadaceae bacterium]|nr:DNA repair protein RecN [Fimbriimonadaceae bacterium]